MQQTYHRCEPLQSRDELVEFSVIWLPGPALNGDGVHQLHRVSVLFSLFLPPVDRRATLHCGKRCLGGAYVIGVRVGGVVQDDRLGQVPLQDAEVFDVVALDADTILLI